MNNRTLKSMRNVIVSVCLYLIFFVFEFLNRSAFIQVLGAEYLGLNGLYRNIVSVLLLSELGIGTAISFSLYKPLSEGNREQIKSIMHLYKRMYQVIGTVILIAGGVMAPFLDGFMKERPADIRHYHIYFIFYILNAGVSYFYTYKRTIIICDQKQYISSMTATGSKIILSLLQIIILQTTHNYAFYLLSMILATITENLIISCIADRQYPYLKEKKIEEIGSEELSEIKKNIFAMFFHKVGTIVISSTDNIVISKFIGLVSVGLYSNYVLITNALNQLMTQFFSALTASVGNLTVEEDDVYKEIIFFRILFLNFWLYGFMSVCLFSLLQPFIILWLGDKYLFDMGTIVVIVFNFYINGMRNTVLLFRNASGIFYQDRYKPVLESAVNLICSIPLAIFLGVKGVLMGTIISTVTVALWVEGVMLYKYTFHQKPWRYFARQGIYTGIAFVAVAVTYWIAEMIQAPGIIGLSVKILICIIVPNLVFVLIFSRSRELRYYISLLRGISVKFLYRRKHHESGGHHPT